MADEPNPNPVVESPPPAPPLEPVEALDPEGVPWRNRAAEAQRKLQETEQAKQALLEAISATRQGAPPPAQPAVDELGQILKQWRPEDQQGLRQLADYLIKQIRPHAQAEGYSLMTKVSLNSMMQQNPAIKQEAEKLAPIFRSNPFWSGVSDEQIEAMAIQQAAATIQAKAVPQNPGMPPPVNIPGTRGGSQPPSGTDPKEKFVKDWMANEENKGVFQHMFRGKASLDSPEGQKAMREAAEIAYDESQKPLPYFGPNSVVGRAAASIINQAKGVGQ